jgi:hypothetical protein
MPGFVWQLYDVGGVYALCEMRDVSFVGCTILPGAARLMMQALL